MKREADYRGVARDGGGGRAMGGEGRPRDGERIEGGWGRFEANQIAHLMDPETIAIVVFLGTIVYGWGIFSRIQKMN